jgi:hypothetical protein
MFRIRRSHNTTVVCPSIAGSNAIRQTNANVARGVFVADDPTAAAIVRIERSINAGSIAIRRQGVAGSAAAALASLILWADVAARSAIIRIAFNILADSTVEAIRRPDGAACRSAAAVRASLIRSARIAAGSAIVRIAFNILAGSIVPAIRRPNGAACYATPKHAALVYGTLNSAGPAIVRIASKILAHSIVLAIRRPEGATCFARAIRATRVCTTFSPAAPAIVRVSFEIRARSRAIRKPLLATFFPTPGIAGVFLRRHLTDFYRFAVLLQCAALLLNKARLFRGPATRQGRLRQRPNEIHDRSQRQCQRQKPPPTHADSSGIKPKIANNQR